MYAPPQRGGGVHAVKNGYIGVNETARKIKKGYIGVGGLARPFYAIGGGTPAHYGTIPLGTNNGFYTDYKYSYGEDAHLDNHAIFFFTGRNKTGVISVNANLVVSTAPTNTSYAPKFNASASLGGKYALIAGGYDMSGSDITYNTVNAYSRELIRTIPTNLSTARETLAGVGLGDDYALFGNGRNRPDKVVYDTVDAYSRELVRSNPTGTGYLNYETIAASLNKTYAIFAGGEGSSNTMTVGYNKELTKISVPTAYGNKQSRSGAKGISFKSKAVLVGGKPDGKSSRLNVYNENLVYSEVYTPEIMWCSAVTSLGDHIVGCAIYYDSTYYTYYYKFNENFIYSQVDGGSPRLWGTAQSVGDYAIFTSVHNTDFLDVFKLI